MSLRHHHHRLKKHHSFAVRFAYWTFLINGVLMVFFFGPVMAFTFLNPRLGQSVLWVSFLSVWALGATHAGAAMAAFAAVHSAEDNHRARRTPPDEPVGRTTSQGRW